MTRASIKNRFQSGQLETDEQMHLHALYWKWYLKRVESVNMINFMEHSTEVSMKSIPDLNQSDHVPSHILIVFWNFKLIHQQRNELKRFIMWSENHPWKSQDFLVWIILAFGLSGFMKSIHTLTP